MPVGKPNLKIDLMIVRSGAKLPPRGNETTHPPLHNFQNEYSARIPDAVHVPIAAPAVRKEGIGPSPRISTTLKMMFITVRAMPRDRKSTRLNSSHSQISYAVFCLKKKKKKKQKNQRNKKKQKTNRL